MMIGAKMKMRKMSGKMSNEQFGFNNLFNKQVEFQKLVCSKFGYEGKTPDSIPCDNIDIAKYHLIALLEEGGELAKSDKRWKNFRNTHYDKENKVEELADCFITLCNIAMYSDISAQDFAEAIDKKITENYERIK